MRIVYCIAKTHNSGGMERVLANKANYLVDHGYEVIIITTDQCGKKSFFSLDPRITCYDLAINYEENNGRSFLNKILHYPFKQVIHKRRLTSLLHQVKADVVISMFCNDVSFISSIKDGSKKVLEIHFSKFKRFQYGRKGFWKLADWYRARRDEKLVHMFDKFVVLTEEDRGYWGKLPNITVIPNMLSFNPVEKARLEAKKVIAIGRYTHQKGFEYLIDAWQIVHGVRPEWKLDIIGGGELLYELKSRINEKGLGETIHLNSPTEQIEEVYKETSMLVMSSRYEGLPMVLLEAEAFGVPIVAFACKCGPRDIITDGRDGFLVPEGDINILADRILQLMEDENLRQRMGRAAKQNSQRFLEPDIMNRWIALFYSLEGNNKYNG